MDINSKLKVTKKTIEVELYVYTSRCECTHSVYPFRLFLADCPDLMTSPPWPIIFFYTELELWRILIIIIKCKMPWHIMFGAAIYNILDIILTLRALFVLPMYCRLQLHCSTYATPSMWQPINSLIMKDWPSLFLEFLWMLAFITISAGVKSLSSKEIVGYFGRRFNYQFYNQVSDGRCSFIANIGSIW